MTTDPPEVARDRVTASDKVSPAELLELDRATCLALLMTQHVGRLVTSGTPPAIRVLNYTAFEHVVMFRSDPGPNVDAIIDTPVVFEADMIDARTRSGWSVVVHGVARDVSDHLDGFALAGARVEPWVAGPKNRWVGITIEQVTGRRLRVEVVDRYEPRGDL
jgi:hypothetical protein